MGSHESDSPLNHTHNQTQDNTNTLLHHHHHHHHNHNSHHHRHHCPLHHRHCPHCPLHYHHHYHRNFHSLPPYSTPLLHNPLPLALAAVDYNQTTNAYHDDDAQISQELERIELDDGEQDDEPVFVLTDEWREFFAKSEAKRKLEKQSKKGKK